MGKPELKLIHPLTPGIIAITLSACLLFAFSLGVVSRLLRPYLNFSIHMDALGSLVILCIANLGLIYWHRLHPLRLALFCIFAEPILLWTGFCLGFITVHGRYWDDVAIFSACWGFGCAVFSAIVLPIIQKIFPRKLAPTPNCPNCGYLLVGLPEPRCPECGRPFTPEELCLPPEAFNAPALKNPNPL